MRFRILHTLRFRYSRAVFLEPHEVRLQPRSCGYQSLREFQFCVDPIPAGITHCLDAEGNNLARMWFDGRHRELTVTARCCVETRRENPFDYLLSPSQPVLPLSYDAFTERLVGAAKSWHDSGPERESIAAFAGQVKRQSGTHLLDFLDRLNRTIAAEFECVRREEGEAWPAVRTYAQRRGACRDLAVLFVEVCRAQGIAARFVSGYQEGDVSQDRRDLHAWAEVYVPGGGWRGYDPTHGLAVADRHVAVAAATDPRLAAAVTGTFRGTGATATMAAEIELTVEEWRQSGQSQQQR